jgi:hypothetical protein
MHTNQYATIPQRLQLIYIAQIVPAVSSVALFNRLVSQPEADISN